MTAEARARHAGAWQHWTAAHPPCCRARCTASCPSGSRLPTTGNHGLPSRQGAAKGPVKLPAPRQLQPLHVLAWPCLVAVRQGVPDVICHPRPFSPTQGIVVLLHCRPHSFTSWRASCGSRARGMRRPWQSCACSTSRWGKRRTGIGAKWTCRCDIPVPRPVGPHCTHGMQLAILLALSSRSEQRRDEPRCSAPLPVPVNKSQCCRPLTGGGGVAKEAGGSGKGAGGCTGEGGGC